MPVHWLSPEIKEMIDAREFAGLREVLADWPAPDLAELLHGLSVDDQVVVFRILPRDVAADAFEYLEHEAQEELLKAMAHEQVSAILNEMSPDDRTMLLEELPASATRQLLNVLTPQERAIAVKLLGYPEDSIGRLMTPEYVAVREE